MKTHIPKLFSHKDLVKCHIGLNFAFCVAALQGSQILTPLMEGSGYRTITLCSCCLHEADVCEEMFMAARQGPERPPLAEPSGYWGLLELLPQEGTGELFTSPWTFSGVQSLGKGDVAEGQWGLPWGRRGRWEPLAMIPEGDKSSLAVTRA